MYFDVVLNPAEIALLPQRDLSGTTCVVFDILRATSSMITALAHGAKEIWPVKTIEDALALKERYPGAILGGERQGDLIPGFAVGNSPLEYRETMAGQTIISTTTNGTVALRACEHAQRVLVGAVLNLDALVATLRRLTPERVLLICAGTFADFSLEDSWAAGAVLNHFPKSEMGDAALVLQALVRAEPEPLPVLRRAKNGVALASKGRSADVDWCAQRSRYEVVGVMENAVIRPLVL